MKKDEGADGGAISLLGALAAKICEINRVEIVQNGFSNSKSVRRAENKRRIDSWL